MCLLKYSFQILGIVPSDALVTAVLSAFLLGLFICPVNSGLHSSTRHISDCLGVISCNQPSLALSRNWCLDDIVDPQM